MYMALYRLIDGEDGIEELNQWLRNVQVSMTGAEKLGGKLEDLVNLHIYVRTTILTG